MVITPTTMRKKARKRKTLMRGRAGHVSSSTPMPTHTPVHIDTRPECVEIMTTRPC